MINHIIQTQDDEYARDFLQARRWLYDVGGDDGALVSDKLRPLVGLSGRGFFLRAPAQKGEVLLRIPQDALLRAPGDDGVEPRKKAGVRLGSIQVDLAAALDLAMRLLAEAEGADGGRLGVTQMGPCRDMSGACRGMDE